MARYSKYFTSIMLGILVIAGALWGIGGLGDAAMVSADNVTTINMTLTEEITISTLDITLSDLTTTIDEATATIIAAMDGISDTADRLFEAFVLFAIIALAFWKEKTWPFLLVFAGLVGIFLGVLWLKDYTAVSIIIMSFGFCLIVIPIWRKFVSKKKSGTKKNSEEEEG